jgi:hypothetical protein
MKKYVLSRVKTLDLLHFMAGSSGDNNVTLYLPPNSSTAQLENQIKNLATSVKISSELVKITTASPNGAAIYRAEKQIRLVMPPFPVKDTVFFDTADTTPLKTMLEKAYTIGLLLVRLGSFAVGVSRGDTLINSKVGTGLIHGRHRQGGSSSHRFERHRDKQIETFLIRVCGHVREQLEPYAKAMDFMVYGGARTTILMAQKYCPFLEKLDKPVLPPLLDIPEPRLPVLKEAINRVWSSTVYEWSED